MAQRPDRGPQYLGPHLHFCPDCRGTWWHMVEACERFFSWHCPGHRKKAARKKEQET